jgi:hypothetical protein
MRIRAVHALVPVLVVAVCGCGLLKKKKQPGTFQDGTTTTGAAASLEPAAFNRADLVRFPDEVLLHGQADFVRQITFARTAPDEGGTTVGVIDPDTAILKWSLRGGNTLITFDRQAFPGKKFAGWVPASAFTVATATATATATPTATATTGGLVGNAPTGDCKTTLRVSGFTPSSGGCSFNSQVRSSGGATMNFPCAGGSASARFGSQTFTGTADRSRVQLSNTSLFPFSGCSVRAIQTISGTPPNLSYSYSEFIVSGTCKGTSTCRASAAITASSN